MTDQSSRSGIVRPFGLTGGQYEVGPAGLLYHRLAWIVAMAAIAAIVAGSLLNWSESLILGIAAAAIAASVFLSFLAVRNGTRL